jgi:hypothetical protein
MTNFKPTRKVNSAKVACGEFFRLGVADYRAGQPWREIEHRMNSTNYERGRHFAAIFAGRIYQGRGMNWKAKEALFGAVSQRVIL